MFLLQLMESAKKKKFSPAALILLMLPAMLLFQWAVLRLTEAKIGANYGGGCPIISWVAMGAQDMDNGRSQVILMISTDLPISPAATIERLPPKQPGAICVKASGNGWKTPSKMYRILKKRF